MLAAKLPTRSIGVTPSNSIALAFRASPAPASVIAILLPRSNKIVQKPDSCPFVQLFLSYQAINLSVIIALHQRRPVQDSPDTEKRNDCSGPGCAGSSLFASRKGESVGWANYL